MDPITSAFDRRFRSTHQRSTALLEKLTDDELFRRPRQMDRTLEMFSCGEFLIRSAAAVEQTCGGITTRLWDDPFEWTLPEKLSTVNLVSGYLDEVEATRRNAFGFLASDADLLKQIPAPETLRSILDLLLETLARAEHFQGRAFAIFRVLSDAKLPRL